MTMLSSRGRSAVSLLWRRHSARRLLMVASSSSSAISGTSPWPSSWQQQAIPSINTTTTRQFSAKNRKRKEEKRRKRELKKQEQPQPVVEGEAVDPITVIETTTETATETTTEKETPPPPPPPPPPLVTQTKAGSLADAQPEPQPVVVEEGGFTVAAAPEDEEEEEVWEGKQTMPDREKELQLIQLQTQVSLLYKDGRYKEGLQLAEETLTEIQDHFGASHPATASSALNLGLFHKQLGDFPKAKSLYQQALQAYADTVGTDHASYAMVLHNLGMLHQSQLHFDQDLQLTDRLRLMEEALEYLEQAYQIRSVELPPDHPHVVATQSALGMTLTAHVLHQHKPVSQKEYSSDTKRAVPTAASYRSVLPPAVTEQSWVAAEDHLRKALDKALRNPKGDSSLKRADKNHYLNIQKKQSLTQKHHKSKKEDTEVLQPPLQTATAATAAQNLAVFLKARSTTVETTQPAYKAWVKEAQDLYQDALQVRVALLPKGHPDIYITQYSLAELFEYTGQDPLAQALRQTIVDTYDPPAEQQQQEGEEEQQKSQQKS